MAKKPEVEKPLENDGAMRVSSGGALSPHHDSRLDAIEDYLVNLGKAMGHIGIPTFTPYPEDQE
jgi:hypothetical protein